ncbi:MAG: Asp23/Gls24 family envelope stress response protein [Ruminococcus sp.]|nr:Asp23/Gls24 family envelope stress response protein [Ruminococcus sp.]
MEAEQIKKAVGRLKIADDVIISVAKLAALDVKGVSGLCGDTGLMSKLKDNGAVKVTAIGDVAAVDISIKIKNGERADIIAQAVQSAVKENVQNMTGVAVARVNVKIGGAVFE